MKGIYRISQQHEEKLGRKITKFDPAMDAGYKVIALRKSSRWTHAIMHN